MKKILLSLLVIPFCLSSQNTTKTETISVKNSYSEILSRKKLLDINVENKTLNSTKSTLLTTIDTTYFDSFENFNQELLIPNNWSTEYNTESTHYWHITEALTILETIVPSDQDYMMWINFDTKLVEQDAWLISPEIQPKEGDSLEFDLYYAPIFMYYKYNENTGEFYFDFSSPTATMKIMVSEAGSDNWTELWDAHSLAGMYDEENIFDYMGMWNWYKVSLQPYVGKTIKLAFQYVGLNGDSMALDRILVGKEKNSNSIERHDVSKNFNVKHSGNSFDIQTPEGFKTVNITSLNGMLIGTYNLDENGTTQINASEFTDNIYIFSFKSNDKHVTIKVLNR